MNVPREFLEHPAYNTTFKFITDALTCLGPGFCSNGSGLTCVNTTFFDCPTCNKPGIVIYFMVAVLILITIFAGNLAIVWTIVHGGQAMRNNMNYIRLSMCVSDFIVGAVLAFSLIPNLVITLKSNAIDLALKTGTALNSPWAIAFGILFTLGYTSSMYHLLLLSIYRLIALNWPLWYQVHGSKRLWFCLLAVWAFSVLTASILGAVSRNIAYTYYEPNFINLPTLVFKHKESAALKAESLSAFVISALFIPYALVTVVLVVTSFQVHQKMAESKKFNCSGQRSKRILNREMELIKTIAIMFFSFSITICPLTICFLLLFSQPPSAACHVTTPVMVCTLLAMANSAVNVIVYGLREKKFRNILSGKFNKVARRLERPSISRVYVT